MGQNPDVAKEFELNPVVVTGTGTHQRLKNTTAPVAVVTANEIKRAGITDFQQAMTMMVPSLSFNPTTMGSYLMMNGLGNKYVLILVNGHKLIGDISNNIDLERIDMSRIKRIEVLNGAASSIYGSDAIAGVINIITNDPEDEITFTSSSKYSGKGQYTQDVNLDIAKGKFGSSTAYRHTQANNWQNSPYETVTANMDAFREKGLIFGASITVTTENVEEVTSREFLDSLIEKGCKLVIFVEYVPVTEDSRHLAPGDAEIKKEFTAEDIQIALTHVPLTKEYVEDMVYWSGKEDFFSLRYTSLILAGYYNAGQWRLPGAGPVYVPEKGWFPGDQGITGLEYLAGIPQHISPGMGTSPQYTWQPGRLFNSPVITRIVLTRKAQ